MSWRFRWQFNEVFTPGASTSITIYIENKGNTLLYFTNFTIDFGKYSWKLPKLFMQIPSSKTNSSGSGLLSIPKGLVGKIFFQINYQVYQQIKGKWNYVNYFSSPSNYYVQIIPQPMYTIFVSRGLHIEDRIVGDPIAQMIREWGFNTITVGIEVQESIKHKVPEIVREEIKKSDAVILIATSRYIDSNGAKKVFEWAEGEMGIGFAEKKPLLIFKENNIELKGLSSYLVRYGPTPPIEFNRYNVEHLRQYLDYIMPQFRDAIKTKGWTDFIENLKDSIGKATLGAITVTAIYGLMGAFDQSTTGKKYKKLKKTKSHSIYDHMSKKPKQNSL